MNDDRYERTLEELQELATKWWPREVRAIADEVSILQILLKSQEMFISILKLVALDDFNLFQLLDAALMDYHKFLKHLMVLSDVGAEPLKRVNKNFAMLFPKKRMTYKIGDKEYTYKFQSLPVGDLSNERMRVDTIEHLDGSKFDKKLCQDVIMILMFGASSTRFQTRAVLYKCNIAEILGDYDRIDEFVRQNYIRVSRIIGGKTATDLGNVAQKYLYELLVQELGEEYEVTLNGTVPGITKNDGQTDAVFDIVVNLKNNPGRRKKYVGIEVSFQETTNSTIERKSQEARNLFEKMASARNFVANVIDGAGNFERKAAIRVMCENSHCNVAFSPSEFEVLKSFIREKLG